MADNILRLPNEADGGREEESADPASARLRAEIGVEKAHYEDLLRELQGLRELRIASQRELYQQLAEMEAAFAHMRQRVTYLEREFRQR